MLTFSRASSMSTSSGRSMPRLIGRCLAVVAAAIPLSLGIAACAGNPPPVPVFASRADWEILSGHWRGSYTTSPSGRHGVIEFTLSAGDEQASGDVLMVADGAHVPYRPYPPNDSRQGPIDAPYTQLLTIRFVRADRGKISGTIASYGIPIAAARRRRRSSARRRIE